MTYLMEINNLGKRYDDFELSGVSLAVEPGCVVGFIGSNGAGKTTTIKAVLGIIAAALAQLGAAHTAGAGTGGILALIFLQPMGNMLHIDRLIFRLNGLFHRDHMHTDTGTAGGHHGGDLLQR